MPKFKVLGGFHDHTEPGSPSHGRRYMGEVKGDNGVIIRQGEILHSKFDLRQDFANKFELVSDSTPISRAQPVPGMQNVEQELAKIEAATPLKPTVSIPAAPKPAAGAETPVSGAMVENVATDADDADDAPVGPQGKDVTDAFPKAQEEDYKVFKNGKAGKAALYDVYDADSLADGPVASGLPRGDVDGAIATDLKKRQKA